MSATTTSAAPGTAWRFDSALAGIAWPAIPEAAAAARAALLWQLDKSQWLAPEALRERQLRQLGLVVQHAWNSVPWYRERWHGSYDPDAPLTRERFEALPQLARADLQGHFPRLKSSAYPEAHGGIGESGSSGSTGVPVRVLKTDLTSLFWNAITLRDHQWHGRDLGAHLAVIRHDVKPGEFANWGPATAGLVATGPCSVTGVGEDMQSMLQWLEARQPDYLMVYPSILAELARLSLRRGARLDRLREVRSFGELLAPEVRALCREAWGVAVKDVYSADEVGYIALQCPEHEHYHIMSESLLVEILDDAGRACAPGETGRVVVTTLHNFAVPLVRYELGDFAEAGAACSCGRGLPVLKRVIGRVRNTLVTADGRRFWPTLGMKRIIDMPSIRQVQVVQKTFDAVEVRLVAAGRLPEVQETEVRELVRSRLPPGFGASVVYVDHIARGPSGKYEDFLSELAPAVVAGATRS